MYKYLRFTVKTRHPAIFPIDMLRYDACWPESSSDSNKITESFIKRTEAGVEITLLKVGAHCAHARWQSFGWDVVIEVRF